MAVDPNLIQTIRMPKNIGELKFPKPDYSKRGSLRKVTLRNSKRET